MTSATTKSTVVVDRYFDVISDGPLIIVRMPCIRRETRDGRVSTRAHMRWRNVLKSIGSLMRSHGFRLKDVYAIELIAPAAETPQFEAEWRERHIKLDAAFGGDPTTHPDFWLYNWENGAFWLARPATTKMVTP